MNDLISIINEVLYNFNQSEYLKWKRKNVTIRGLKEVGEENGGGAILGRGLYTAFLSNKELAKQYGKVYFVVGAIPKNPKIFNTLNDWEIWSYNTLIYNYLKNNNLLDDKNYGDKRIFFSKTTIENEMQKLGYDGVIIKGREMVNYTPNENNIRYFENENQLIQYYETIIKKGD